jgi:hypothetical protein
LDINNLTYSPKTHGNGSGDQARLVARFDAETDSITGPWNGLGRETTVTGAELAIGNTVATGEESSFINLKSLVAIQNARKSVATTQEDAAALIMVITAGVTVTTPGGLDISEIGMFARFRSNSPNESSNAPGRRQLLAYDFFSPVTNVPNGGVIAPRYTLSFAA